MKVAVVIATMNRREVLADVLAHLEKQTRPPDTIVLSAPDETHIPAYDAKTFSLDAVFGPKGSCVQRNRALSRVRDYDIITFLDDDFLPAFNYFERLTAAFAQHPEWAVIMGNVASDGAHGPGFTFAQGLAQLERIQDQRRETPLEPVSKHIGAYGCNMSVRGNQLGDVRFDERLPLYGWQEDIDFTSQLRRHGDIVSSESIFGVHLGVKSGRVSGIKLGYSQICNPAYLVRKGTMPASFALPLMTRNLLANMAKSLWAEPYVDRRGRLRGNLLAAFHLMRGKIEPEYILKL